MPGTTTHAFAKHSLLAFLVLFCLVLQGSQNHNDYLNHWRQLQLQWLSQCQTAHFPKSRRQTTPECEKLWRRWLRMTMDYNREVNQFPGTLWFRNTTSDAPVCLIIPETQIPYGQRLSAVTPVLFCDVNTSTGISSLAAVKP